MPRKIRPIRVEGNVAFVTLTRGYEAVIDAADVLLVGGWNWFALVRPHTVYAYRTDCSSLKKRTVMLHRVIAGEPEALEVDHIDCDGLNNRRSNLRAATRAQNMHNMRTPKRNTSGFKGVGFDRLSGQWRAYIKINGKQHHLGCFTTPEDAHEAYVTASDRLHGEFGRIA